MSKVKNLYKGIFQTNKSFFVERYMAYSEKQAKNIFMRRIAGKQNVKYPIVSAWFENSDKYSIAIETEFKETG